MKPLERSSNTQHRKRAAAIAIACSALLVLSGCGIPKLRFADPPAMMPDSFNGATSEENSSWVPPTEFFEDPYLTSLIDQGLAGNQNLKILAQDIQIANNEVLRRRGAYLPFVSLGARASLEKPSLYTPFGAADDQLTFPPGTHHFPTPLPDFLTAADVTWQIDIWRQLRNARDAQVFRYLGTIEGWNYVVTRLVADISDNYYQLMALDKQLETLDRTIVLQERGLQMAQAQKEGVRGSELGVQRFQAEVRKNQSQKQIVYQQIVETENEINFLVGRFPQRVERDSSRFIELNLRSLAVGVPAQLMANRPDIRQAERELAATGLDVRVARANFYPKLIINAGVGYEAFNTKYLFITPESLIYNVAGELVGPLINKRAIQADYLNANARQLQAVYDYQRTTLNAFTEVVNRISKVQNYSRSIEIKKQQLTSLEAAVSISLNLFQNARLEYLDVLLAQRDFNEARMVLIDTKQEQLSAIVNAYQALGGGWRYFAGPPIPMPVPTGQPQVPVIEMPVNEPPVGQPVEMIPTPPMVQDAAPAANGAPR